LFARAQLALWRDQLSPAIAIALPSSRSAKHTGKCFDISGAEGQRLAVLVVKATSGTALSHTQQPGVEETAASS